MEDINFWKIEDNLNLFNQMEDDLNILVNARQTPKLKTTMQPKTNNKMIFKEQHRIVTSCNLTNTTTKQMSQLKK